MRIAIVHGGFDGIRRQHTVWKLEAEVEDCKERLANAYIQLQKAQHTLRNRIDQLERAEEANAR